MRLGVKIIIISLMEVFPKNLLIFLTPGLGRSSAVSGAKRLKNYLKGKRPSCLNCYFWLFRAKRFNKRFKEQKPCFSNIYYS